jgi:hypothetical protein
MAFVFRRRIATLLSLPMSRSYSREEAQAILSRAVERQHDGDQLTHEELLAIGRELGVSREAIDAAAAGVGDQLAVDREVRVRVARARRSFLLHLVPFLLVNLLLVTINVMTTSFLWFLFPLLGWGIGLGSHALVALAPDRDAIATKVRRRMEREREKQRRAAERSSLQLGARRLAEAVQDRTAEVLHAVADALEDAGPGEAGKVRVEPPAAGGKRVPTERAEGAGVAADAEDEEDDEASSGRAAR